MTTRRGGEKKLENKQKKETSRREEGKIARNPSSL